MKIIIYTLISNMASIYKKRINNTFLRTLFSDTNYRN